MVSQILRNTLRRSYATTTTASTASLAKPPRKIGAVRGGFLGFLLGVSVTGFGSYYYLIDEYRAANKAIVGDVLSLEKTISSLEEHVRVLESKVNK
ncbi:hypothetical protein DASC09_011230 [Saccharomycopsis crataegensis]|uniref:Uncharacterized protein n=1 Tax=Saccharomycopsis crataegensis TaxID=43959 RepID=A0AAV5QG36_9ASCO|nr:hypothetical protein DASC09_011230 [Saccharomycopsis crataegensis]